MKLSRIILINLMVIVALVLVGALIAYYWVQNYNYVSSQDASIAAPTVQVVAPAAGVLSGIHVTVGQHVTKGQVIGQETVAAPGKAAMSGGTVNITAPITGSVASIQAYAGQSVAQGTALLSAVRLNQITVVANILETKIHRIRIGQTVSIHVDAHPGVTFTGHVSAIQPATQSFFSLLPTSASAGSYTKVVQRVPVTIAINAAGYTLLPGESCEVRVTIH